MANRVLIPKIWTISKQLSVLFVFFLFFGLLMIGSSSVVDAARDFNDKWYYLKLQTFWSVLSLIVFLIMSNFSHKKLNKYGFYMFILTLFLLIAVMIPGIGTKLLGARRWINFGFFSIQPSEVAKISMAVYLSALLSSKVRFSVFAGSLGIVSLLILLQPDMGTALVIISLGMALYFGSGGDLKKIIGLLLIGILGLGILIIATPYRFHRLKSFFDYSSDPQGNSYQIRQALIALGQGGIFGNGLGQSKQKYDYLPEATTDSIFAIIGEELGLVGTTGVVLLFLTLIILGLETAANTSGFSQNLALSMTTIIGSQAFINMSAITALIPLTGIPLTFISYGGSSLVTMGAVTGILVNISKQP